MLIIAGAIRVEPADRQNYLDRCVGLAESARGAPGCLDFHLTPDPVDDDRVNVFERWDSDSELESFRKGESGNGYDPGDLPEVLDNSVKKYRISSVEEP